MDKWTEFENELVAACREHMDETLPIVCAQEDWLGTVQDLLKKVHGIPGGPALLVNGPDGIRRVPLAGTSLTLGRSSDCTVHLPYRFVSREHCRLRLEEEQWVIEDLDSTNGTLVNGVARANGPLLAGDVLQVGEATILFLPPERGVVPEPPE